MVILKYKKLDKTIPDPVISTEGSFGIDLFAAEDVIIGPLCSASIPLGVVLEIPKNHVGLLKSRSGHSFKSSIESHLGYIDSDFRGELRIHLYNNQKWKMFNVKKGDKIAQIGIVPYPKIILKEVESVTNTERGEGGFGSTGR